MELSELSLLAMLLKRVGTVLQCPVYSSSPK
jgi:hypothetical protein